MSTYQVPIVEVHCAKTPPVIVAGRNEQFEVSPELCKKAQDLGPTAVAEITYKDGKRYVSDVLIPS